MKRTVYMMADLLYNKYRLANLSDIQSQIYIALFATLVANLINAPLNCRPIYNMKEHYFMISVYFALELC